MFRLFRLFIIFATGGVFWLGWFLAPGLMNTSNLRYLAGLFTILFTSCLAVLPKISDLTAMPGLDAREKERLAALLATVRRRIWWMVLVSAVGSAMVWFVGSASLLAKSPVRPAAIGILIGIGISYAVVLPGWFNEVQAFIDQIRVREERKRQVQETLKRIEDGRKSGGSSALSA